MKYQSIHPVLRAVLEGIALGFGALLGMLALLRLFGWMAL